MTDSDLNLAIHQEVEGWKPACGTAYGWYRYVDGKWQRTDHEPVPDYCNDPVWCVQMMEKHGLQTFRDCDAWEITDGEEVLGRDTSLTRAVALAVLQLTREGK